MSTYGRQFLGGGGRQISVLADGNGLSKGGGITLLWSLVAAVNADTTLQPSGVFVPNGAKYLRYGQTVCMVNQREVQTLTITATGGTFKITPKKPDGSAATQTAAIAYNATAATIQAAMDAAIGANEVVIGGTGPFTFTFINDYDGFNIGLPTVDNTAATGGTATFAATTDGTANFGYYGPYDPNATDGRQLLTPGRCFWLNDTVFEKNPVGMYAPNNASDHPGAFYGGRVWKSRLVISDYGTAHSLATGPTFSEFAAAFPQTAYQEDL